jgi:hypothetical protein
MLLLDRYLLYHVQEINAMDFTQFSTLQAGFAERQESKKVNAG